MAERALQNTPNVSHGSAIIMLKFFPRCTLQWRQIWISRRTLTMNQCLPTSSYKKWCNLAPEIDAHSEDSQNALHFLGIPQKYDTFWGSLESVPICRLARSLGIPSKYSAICGKCELPDSAERIHWHVHSKPHIQNTHTYCTWKISLRIKRSLKWRLVLSVWCVT